MSERTRTTKRKERRQARDEGIEAGIDAMYKRSKGRLVSLAKRDADFERRQAQVGLASNILGIAAGTAALATAAKNPALRKPTADNAGPVTRRAMRKIKTPKGKAALIAAGAGGALALQGANLGGDVVANRVLSREAKVGKAMDKKETISTVANSALLGSAGGYLGYKLGRPSGFDTARQRIINDQMTQKLGPENVAAMGAAGRKAKAKAVFTGQGAKTMARGRLRRMSGRSKLALSIGAGGALLGGASGYSAASKSIEQSYISKSDPVTVTGHGQSLVEKRNFNAEADRQRRLGLYAGAGLGAGAVLGDAARRRMPRIEEELKDGRKIKRFDMPKGRRGRLTLAALAGGAALSAGGGVGAYRRGISERNNTYL